MKSRLYLVEIDYEVNGQKYSYDFWKSDAVSDNFEAEVLDRISSISRGGAVITSVSQQWR